MIRRLILRLKKILESTNIIGKEVVYDDSCTLIGSTLTGKVTLGAGCRVYKSYLSGPITIGRYTSLSGPNTDLWAKINPISIGNFCSIARNVTMQEYNHNPKKISTYFMGKNVFSEVWKDEQISKAGIEVGHDVWIGTHCVLLSGAKIGNGAIIAANSVVTGEIPAYAIAAGSPAKVIKYRFSEEMISSLNALGWWHWPMEKIQGNKQLFENDFNADTLTKVINS